MSIHISYIWEGKVNCPKVTCNHHPSASTKEPKYLFIQCASHKRHKDSYKSQKYEPTAQNIPLTSRAQAAVTATHNVTYVRVTIGKD